MLADVPNQFKIECAFPDSLRGRFIPIVMAGGPGLRDSVKAVYERLVAHPERMYRDAHEHYRVLRTSTLQISTPNREIDLAFEWAKVAYDNLFVNNPHLGLGMIAGLGPSGTGGRPGFGWFFGGDAFINAFSMNSYGAFSSTRDALAFTEQWQRADGKMAHELSQAAAYVDWWKDYPYGYIHGDTSPFFLCAAEDYFRMTGDSAFVRSSWNTIRKAYEWSLATDEDHDGLMDNRKAGLGALEYGPLTDIQSDVYTGAVWVRATDAMVALADVAGQPDLAVHAAGYAKTSHHAFEEKFWDPAHHRYAYAFSKNGTRVDIVSPWSSVGLMWELGDPGRSAQALEELNSAELTTDWGIRSISSRSKYFEALNYNYGAVWPFLSSWVATAQFKHGFGLQGYNLLLANVRHTFDNGLGTVTEVFSGAQNIWPQEAVAHQGFCTAGVVLPLVRGLLGLESDAPGRRISVAPQCPADWPALTIQNWTVGPARFALDYQRLADRITLKITPENANGFRCTFGPVIGSTNTISSVRVNGREVPFRLITSSQSIQPLVDVPVDGATTMEILMQQGVELLPPLIDSKTGDANHGLKIISMKRTGNRLEVSLDGVAGAIYAIGVLNAPRIGSLDGATLADGEIRMTMPPGPFGEFVRHRFTITLNEEHR
jgi:hypothetical protein